MKKISICFIFMFLGILTGCVDAGSEPPKRYNIEETATNEDDSESMSEVTTTENTEITTEATTEMIVEEVTEATTETTTEEVTEAATETTTETTTEEVTEAATEESTEELVWIPASGKKYHSRSGCSNMNNPSQVPKSEAINRGYTPCKKCY